MWYLTEMIMASRDHQSLARIRKAYVTKPINKIDPREEKRNQLTNQRTRICASVNLSASLLYTIQSVSNQAACRVRLFGAWSQLPCRTRPKAEPLTSDEFSNLSSIAAVRSEKGIWTRAECGLDFACRWYPKLSFHYWYSPWKGLLELPTIVLGKYVTRTHRRIEHLRAWGR